MDRFAQFIHSPFNSSAAAIDFHAQSQPSVNGSMKVLREKIAEFSDRGFDVIITSDRKEELERIQDLIEQTESENTDDSIEISDDNEISVDPETSNLKPETIF